jgi:hypothetical protein
MSSPGHFSSAYLFQVLKTLIDVVHREGTLEAIE